MVSRNKWMWTEGEGVPDDSKEWFSGTRAVPRSRNNHRISSLWCLYHVFFVFYYFKNTNGHWLRTRLYPMHAISDRERSMYDDGIQFFHQSNGSICV